MPQVIYSFAGRALKPVGLELLEIKIAKKLNFESHIKSLSSKAPQNLGTLQRISNLLVTQNKNLFSTIIKSQLLPTCLDVLLKKIEFFSELCSRKSSYNWL